MAKTLIAIVVALTMCCVVVAQTKQRFDPSGSFWIDGEPPAAFTDFSA